MPTVIFLNDALLYLALYTVRTGRNPQGQDYIHTRYHEEVHYHLI